jgi:hypothetical protein
MDPDSAHALDSIDRFIVVGGEMAKSPILMRPENVEAADDLYEIAQTLLTSNENMARWLNRFLQFDFRSPTARTDFLQLVAEYRTTKSGQGFHAMKFPCGEIFDIYERRVAASIDQVFPNDQLAQQDAKSAFDELGNADNDMVAFIYEGVIGDIDAFLQIAEPAVDRSDLNGAEAGRLEFKVASADLSERLERLAGGLASLVLQYARLAKRSVTLAQR